MNTAPRRGRYRMITEMNLIPMIDISLVLLMIFMLMTPTLVKSQLKLDLPGSKSSENVKPDDKSVSVQIRGDGSLFVDGAAVTRETIDQILTGKLPDASRQSVMLEADKSVPFEQVVAVMGSIRKLGCTRIGVAVMPEKSAPAPKRKRR